VQTAFDSYVSELSFLLFFSFNLVLLSEKMLEIKLQKPSESGVSKVSFFYSSLLIFRNLQTTTLKFGDVGN
jgi:hypothetical protein